MKIQTTLTWTWYPGAGNQKVEEANKSVDVNLHINHCGHWAICLNGLTAYVELISGKYGHYYDAVVGGTIHSGFTSLDEAKTVVIQSLPGVTVVE